MVLGKRKLFFILLLASFTSLSAQEHFCVLHDSKAQPRERLVDFTHLEAELKFEALRGKVAGKVKHHYKVIRTSLDSLVIDGPGIEILQLTHDDLPVKFYQKEDKIILKFANPLPFNSEHILSIDYEAFPRKGMYFIGWKDTASTVRKQIWTQGQGIDNRHWLPSFDDVSDKITTDISIVFQDGYEVVSNGKLQSKKSKKGFTTWRYKMDNPHAPYLIMIAIGDYKYQETKSKSGVPLKFYYYPDWENRFDATYKYGTEIFDFIEKRMGVPYPWHSYSQVPVQDFLYGAMENTTATIFGDFFFVDDNGFLDANYVFVNAHELAHQWFGDYITARSPEAHWIHESFATFFHTSAEKEFFGESFFDALMLKNTDQILKAGEKDNYPISDSRAGSTRHYQKGAWILHMLKDMIGEEAFYRSLKRFLEENAYQNVSSSDLLYCFYDETGIPLNWFWNQWIYRGGEPELKVFHAEESKVSSELIRVFVQQTHETGMDVGLFKLPLNIELYTEDGSMIKETHWIENAFEEIKITLPKGKRVSFILIDPGNKLLKKMHFERSVDMIRTQADLAPNVIDRYMALRELQEIPLHQKRAFLHYIYKKETHHLTKGEALSQLMDLNDPFQLELIPDVFQHGNTPLKKKVLASSTFIHPTLKSSYELLLTDSSYEVVESALELLCLNFPDNKKLYFEQTKAIYGVRGNNVRVKWLELNYLDYPNLVYIDELVKYTAYGFDFHTRMNAANALRKLGLFNDNFLENLFDGISNPNNTLSRSFGKVLSYYASIPQHSEIILLKYARISNENNKKRIGTYLK